MITLKLTKHQAKKIDKQLLELGITEIENSEIVDKNKELYDLRCKINEGLGN